MVKKNRRRKEKEKKRVHLKVINTKEHSEEGTEAQKRHKAYRKQIKKTDINPNLLLITLNIN